MNQTAIRIGWSEADITPEGPVELAGQYYQRISRGVHSRLKASVLALASPEAGNGEQAILVSLDLVGTPRDLQEELRERVAGKIADFDVRKLLLNAIHTHSAPPVRERSRESKPASGVTTFQGTRRFSAPPRGSKPASGVMTFQEYRELLLDRLAEAVVSAWEARTPGGLSVCLGQAVLGHNRRAWYADGTAEMYGRTDREDFVGMEGGQDSGVEMLFTRDSGGKPTGVVLNFACPAQVMEATYVVSSDFVGEARRLLRERFGERFGVLAQISAAGDQSPRDLPRDQRTAKFWSAEGVAELGRRLSRAAEECFDKAAASVQTNVLFRHAVREIDLPARRASRDEYDHALADLAGMQASEPDDPDSSEAAYQQFVAEVRENEGKPQRSGPHDSKLRKFARMENCKAVIRRYETQDAEPTYKFELHAIRLGDSAMASNPFELFCDYGQQMKARSRAAQTFVVQLAGDVGGYLPTAKAVYGGSGYRGYGALIINGKVGPDGGRKLVDETVAAVNALWDDETG